MKGKSISETTNLSQSQTAERSSTETQTGSLTASLQHLVTRWRREDMFLGLLKPSTDITHLKSEMVERTCSCGCGLTFRVLKTSTQKYWSDECYRLKRAGARPPNHHWRQGMAYMVRG